MTAAILCGLCSVLWDSQQIYKENVWMYRLGMQYFKQLEGDRRSTAFRSRLFPKWKQKGTKKKSLTEFSSLQKKNVTLKTEETTEKRQDLWQTFQEKHLDLKESHIWQISDERAKLEDHLLCGEQESRMKPTGFDSTAYIEQHNRVLCDHLLSHNPPPVFCRGEGFAIFWCSDLLKDWEDWYSRNAVSSTDC